MSIYYIVFFVIAFLALFSYSKIRLIKNISLVLIFIILVLFAGTRYFIDKDYALYEYLFYAAVSKSVIFLAENATLEWCIWLVSKFSQLFYNSFKEATLLSFLIFAVLGVGFKFLAFKKSHAPLFFVLLLYFGNWYLGQEMTTMRAGVAAGIFLLSLHDLENKKNKAFLIKILVALLFHYSAIIFIVIWLIVKQNIALKYFVYATFFSLVFAFTKINILQLLLLDKVIPKVEVYSDLARKGIGSGELNIFNFKIITSFLFLITFLFFYKKVLKNDQLVLWLKIHCLSIIIFFLLTPVQMTFSLRTFELISVIQLFLFPALILIFPRKFSYIPVVMILAVSFFQLYYSVNISENFQPYASWLLK